MITALRSAGWKDGMVRVAYYVNDSGGSRLDAYGSHHKISPGPRDHIRKGSTLYHTNDTSIRHLAYHLAWMVHDRYSSKGESVDVVAHSMGGVLIRYALTQVEKGHTDFPPRLLVGDVVTLGTPHAGAWLGKFCKWADQCAELKPNSSLIRYLQRTSSSPQGAGGTEWTAVSSYDDGVVPYASAIDVGAVFKAIYARKNDVDHSDYLKLNSWEPGATVDVSRDGKWGTADGWIWPIRLTDLALATRGN